MKGTRKRESLNGWRREGGGREEGRTEEEEGREDKEEKDKRRRRRGKGCKTHRETHPTPQVHNPPLSLSQTKPNQTDAHKLVERSVHCGRGMCSEMTWMS